VATTKYAIPTLDPNAPVKNGPTDVNAALTAIDSTFVGYSEGSFASRPTSSPSVPGIPGRLYRVPATGRIYRDYGTGWQEIAGAIRKTVMRAQAIVTSTTKVTLAVNGTAPIPPILGAAWVNPADHAPEGVLNPTYQIRWVVLTNSVTPGQTVALRLKQTTSVSGASGSPPAMASEAIVGSASTPTLAASDIRELTISPLAPLAAGIYSMEAYFNAAPATGAQAIVLAELQVI
jgi:hypothetical protein